MLPSTQRPPTQHIAATSKGLADGAVELGAASQAQIETAPGEAGKAMAAENTETKTGDPKQLQAACAALDAATRPLADLLNGSGDGGVAPQTRVDRLNRRN